MSDTVIEESNVEELVIPEGARAFPDEGVLDGTVGGACDPDGQKAQSEEGDEDDENESVAVVSVPRLDADLQVFIDNAINDLDQLDSESKEISSRRKQIVERLEQEGINKHALAFYRKFDGMSDKKREGFDLSYLLLRKAGKQPMQTDWIDD